MSDALDLSGGVSVVSFFCILHEQKDKRTKMILLKN